MLREAELLSLSSTIREQDVHFQRVRYIIFHYRQVFQDWRFHLLFEIILQDDFADGYFSSCFLNSSAPYTKTPPPKHTPRLNFFCLRAFLIAMFPRSKRLSFWEFRSDVLVQICPLVAQSCRVTLRLETLV